jgi:hypothetical protein
MVRISLPYVYEVVEKLERIGSLKPGEKFEDSFFDLWMAEHTVEMFLMNSVFSPTLRTCRQLGEQLLAHLKGMQKIEFEKLLTPTDTIPIVNAFSRFKTALLAEIGTFPSYFVTQKGGYDTLTLLDQSWRMFPINLGTKVPEAMFDVAEAGKALCFELGTACGYHVFRATETVLRRYYNEVTKGSAPPRSVISRYTSVQCDNGKLGMKKSFRCCLR